MGELDFKDMYWQIKLDLESQEGKDKLSYLCIRTCYGTMAYSRAAMGLLGMDCYQEELTNRVFGDLVVSNQLVKIADNVYFCSDSLSTFHGLLKIICSHFAQQVRPSFTVTDE
jgi:hypothetical protein